MRQTWRGLEALLERRAVICRLSPARERLVCEDPELVEELLAARHEGGIAGLISLDDATSAFASFIPPAILDGIYPLAGTPIEGQTGTVIRVVRASRVAEIAAVLVSVDAEAGVLGVTTATHTRRDHRALLTCFHELVRTYQTAASACDAMMVIAV